MTIVLSGASSTSSVALVDCGATFSAQAWAAREIGFERLLRSLRPHQAQ
jgi:hypothetical protein